MVAAPPDASMLGKGNQNAFSNEAKTTSNKIQFNGIDGNNLAQSSPRSMEKKWVRDPGA